MPEGKLKVYSEEEAQAKIESDALTGWYLEDGWLRRNIAPTAGRRRSCW